MSDKWASSLLLEYHGLYSRIKPTLAAWFKYIKVKYEIYMQHLFEREKSNLLFLSLFQGQL